MGLRLLGRPEKKEKKESTVKGDWRDPAKQLPCVNGIFSFYRDLDVGLLVWIHYHHG